MKEATIQKWVRDQLDKEFGDYCVYIKYPAGPYSSKGVSDLIFCVHGYYVAIEVKTDIGKATALQTRFCDAIKAAGGLAYIIYGKDNLLINQVIDDIKRRRLLSSKTVESNQSKV